MVVIVVVDDVAGCIVGQELALIFSSECIEECDHLIDLCFSHFHIALVYCHIKRLGFLHRLYRQTDLLHGCWCFAQCHGIMEMRS